MVARRMCGIGGYFGEFQPELLDAMGSALAHRGPDGMGSITGVMLRSDDGIGLVHRRLSIIDLSPLGRQPMTTCCSRCGTHDTSSGGRLLWLTYNGELYNYRALRAELEGRGHVLQSRTDSEVLLHLYAESGTAMLGRMNGIFAFGIYDGTREGGGGALFLARDPIGVKPLYYAVTPRGFLFASEIKAILCHKELSREIDPAAVHASLAYLWTPAPATALRAVRKCEPGAAMMVRDGKVERYWRYYDLPYGRASRGLTDADAEAELRSRLTIAVERQMMSDVPVGAFLSGGLDSSAVVATMRRVATGRPQCYTIGFEGGGGAEDNPEDLPYARRVAEHLDVPLTVVSARPDMVDRIEEMIYLLDEPQADPAPINALLIAERAREDGVKVLLSGAGGDDLFGGYRRHAALRYEALWAWLPGPVRNAIAREARSTACGRRSWNMQNPLVRRLVKALSYADAAPDTRLATYFWWSPDELRRKLYSPAWAEALRGVATADPLLESLARIPEERDPLNRMLYLETKHFLCDHNLNYTDRMGMAAGVEVRVPLLDLDLVEFAAGLPGRMKQRGRLSKAVFKRAMQPYLPHEVIYRRKSGFGVPLRRWLREELHDLVDDTLDDGALRRRGMFDPRAVADLVRLDRQGQVDGTYTIFALMCVELWARRFVDTPSVEAPVPWKRSTSALTGVRCLS